MWDFFSSPDSATLCSFHTHPPKVGMAQLERRHHLFCTRKGSNLPEDGRVPIENVLGPFVFPMEVWQRTRDGMGVLGRFDGFHPNCVAYKTGMSLVQQLARTLAELGEDTLHHHLVVQVIPRCDLHEEEDPRVQRYSSVEALALWVISDRSDFADTGADDAVRDLLAKNAEDMTEKRGMSVDERNRATECARLQRNARISTGRQFFGPQETSAPHYRSLLDERDLRNVYAACSLSERANACLSTTFSRAEGLTPSAFEALSASARVRAALPLVGVGGRVTHLEAKHPLMFAVPDQELRFASGPWGNTFFESRLFPAIGWPSGEAAYLELGRLRQGNDPCLEDEGTRTPLSLAQVVTHVVTEDLAAREKDYVMTLCRKRKRALRGGDPEEQRAKAAFSAKARHDQMGRVANCFSAGLASVSPSMQYVARAMHSARGMRAAGVTFGTTHFTYPRLDVDQGMVAEAYEYADGQLGMLCHHGAFLLAYAVGLSVGDREPPVRAHLVIAGLAGGGKSWLLRAVRNCTGEGIVRPATHQSAQAIMVTSAHSEAGVTTNSLWLEDELNLAGTGARELGADRMGGKEAGEASAQAAVMKEKLTNNFVVFYRNSEGFITKDGRSAKVRQLESFKLATTFTLMAASNQCRAQFGDAMGRRLVFHCVYMLERSDGRRMQDQERLAERVAQAAKEGGDPLGMASHEMTRAMRGDSVLVFAAQQAIGIGAMKPPELFAWDNILGRFEELLRRKYGAVDHLQTRLVQAKQVAKAWTLWRAVRLVARGHRSPFRRPRSSKGFEPDEEVSDTPNAPLNLEFLKEVEKHAIMSEKAVWVVLGMLEEWFFPFLTRLVTRAICDLWDTDTRGWTRIAPDGAVVAPTEKVQGEVYLRIPQSRVARRNVAKTSPATSQCMLALARLFKIDSKKYGLSFEGENFAIGEMQALMRAKVGQSGLTVIREGVDEDDNPLLMVLESKLEHAAGIESPFRDVFDQLISEHSDPGIYLFGRPYRRDAKEKDVTDSKTVASHPQLPDFANLPAGCHHTCPKVKDNNATCKCFRSRKLKQSKGVTLDERTAKALRLRHSNNELRAREETATFLNKSLTREAFERRFADLALDTEEMITGEHLPGPTPAWQIYDPSRQAKFHLPLETTRGIFAPKNKARLAVAFTKWMRVAQNPSGMSPQQEETTGAPEEATDAAAMVKKTKKKAQALPHHYPKNVADELNKTANLKVAEPINTLRCEA